MKKFNIVLLALLILALLTGCASGGKELDAAKVADDIRAGVTFEDELKEISSDILDNFYFIEPADLKSFKLYKSASGSTAEEIGVFTASSAEALERVQKAVENRVADLKIAFENYVPEEMAKLENALIKTSGNTVILVIAEDDANAQKVVEAAIK